jgi:hypothetical protein
VVTKCVVAEKMVITRLNPSTCAPPAKIKYTSAVKGKKKGMVTKGVEPSTLALLAPRSNQLS